MVRRHFCAVSNHEAWVRHAAFVGRQLDERVAMITERRGATAGEHACFKGFRRGRNHR
jgi:hypothetical protein